MKNYKLNNIYQLLENDTTSLLSQKDILNKYNSDFLLKMIGDDYLQCQNKKHFFYFNLGIATHLENKIYAPALLIKFGNPNLEPPQPPSISVHPNVRFLSKKIITLENPSELDLVPFIEKSLLIQKNITSLKENLIQRYLPTIPEVKSENIFSRTITITELLEVT